MEKLEIRASAAPWNRAVHLLIRDGDSVATGLEMIRVPPGTYCAPSVTFGFDAAQTLMDDLWVCGIRPTEGAGSAGSLAATQRHLEDMRRLVFDHSPKT